jgi:hypothetical protein
MPLLDHFRQPLATDRPWDGFHSTWAGTMATLLNQRHLPADYFAIPQTRLGGGIEVDIGTFRRNGGAAAPGPAVASAVWAPPAPPLRTTVDYLDQDVFEVRIHQQLGGPQLRAAIELVSPANKDRPGHRHAFAVKCAGYLQQGISVLVVDVVTERQANLHMEILEVLELAAELPWSSPTHLYAVAYRTAVSPGHQQLEAWPEPLSLGAELPTLPLWLEPDLPLPLRLEESYAATCAALKIPG